MVIPDYTSIVLPVDLNLPVRLSHRITPSKTACPPIFDDFISNTSFYLASGFYRNEKELRCKNLSPVLLNLICFRFRISC